ncbi:MAG: hypothetical protein EXQ81_09090 [Thermoleophilia bacterium]|nr:hypothetical protein [Thermoleophilia bacterium]
MTATTTPLPATVAASGSEHSRRRVHVVGGGPVGLMVTALLQPLEWLSVVLYEQRARYTRTRMVHLEPYLIAPSVGAYRAIQTDGDDVEAIFDPSEVEQGVVFRRSIPPDLMSLLEEWTVGFCPLNDIEQSLSDLIAARASNPVEHSASTVSAQDIMTVIEPDDIVIDCTGRKSLLRDWLVPASETSNADGNTVNVELEFALVVTFLYDQNYSCNELCKYYKNAENPHYKFIPSVARTSHDGNVSHVTGIIHITSDEAAAMPPHFDGEWLRGNFPEAAGSMERFIDKIKAETHGEIIGDLQVICIPLNLYRARNATSRLYRTAESVDHPFAHSPVFLVGDSAVGSPYFQSISLGFECAMYLASLVAQPGLPTGEMLDLYETHTYKQWLRVYMRSKMIKHDKDVFEAVDDRYALLELIHLY